METISKFEFWLCRFYNDISGAQAQSLDEIPGHAIELLQALDHETVVRGYVVRDIRRGVAIDLIAERYGITRQRVRNIGRDFGLYKKYRRSAQHLPL